MISIRTNFIWAIIFFVPNRPVLEGTASTSWCSAPATAPTTLTAGRRTGWPSGRWRRTSTGGSGYTGITENFKKGEIAGNEKLFLPLKM